MSINKKIRGATVTEFILSNGSAIVCKSKLETVVIKALIDAQSKDDNIKDIQYEPNKYVIWEGIKPKLPYYVKDKKTKHLKDESDKLRNITYTPDIVFYYKNNIVFVEVKPAFENDTFPIKEKMFRKFLEETYENGNTAYYPIYCKISSRKDMFELIEIIKNKYNDKR